MKTKTAKPLVIQPQDRSAHVAMRGVVNTYGDDSARLLYLAFDWMNAAFFGGVLGAPMILISPPSSRRALGDYTSRDVHGVSSRIRIAPTVFNLGMYEAIVTLLHEMVHAWCAEVLKDTEQGYEGHGPRFTAKCNEIGEQLGYVRVFVKGRGGPNSRMWPYMIPEKAKPAEEPEVIEPEAPQVPEEEGDDPRENFPGELEDLRAELADLRELHAEVSSERDELLEQSGRLEARAKDAHRATSRERGLRVSLEMRVADALHATRAQLEALKLNGRTSGGAPAQLRATLKVLEALGTESSDDAESPEVDDEESAAA